MSASQRLSLTRRAFAAQLAAFSLTAGAKAQGAPVVFRPAYAPAPVDNPLRGFVPYAGQAQQFPHSLEFSYLPLAALMNGPESFTWEPLEKLLDSIAARGCQSIFRVYLEYPRKPSGVPEYLIKDGLLLREWTNTNTQPLPPAKDHTPDYEDPRLRLALRSFIAALGARYDGDARIGFITAGLLGTWGEWHTYPRTEWFASKTVQREVMDAYEKAFKKTPILLRYPAGENDGRFAPNAARNFGYHDDSFAWATLETARPQDSWYYMARLRKAGALDKWKTAPIGGEVRPELWPCLWKENGCEKGQDFAQCVKETHASWLMDSSIARPMTPDEKTRALAAARSLGYEFQITEVSVSHAGKRLEVSVTITNRGVAPFYANWPVQMRAVDARGEIIAPLPFDLKTLLPGEKQTQKASLDTAKLSGEITLQIGVPNPMKGGKPLRFANEGNDENGWLNLGKLTL
jgi:hypothetical protein